MPARHAIPAADGERVVAVHHAPADTGPDGAADGSPWLVFCHGFLSDKAGSYEGRCERAAREGYHAVRFDFRGCGEADGDFVDQTLSDKVADLRAVLAHFDPGSVALFGSSFGGKVAFHAAAELAGGGTEGGADGAGTDGDATVEAIATRAPVTYNRTFAAARREVEREGSLTFETGQTIDGRFFDDLERHPFADAVAAVDCPVLMVHGSEDESVDIADSFEAAGALETDVLLEKVGSEGHRFSEAAEQRLRTRLFDWLGTV
jgi:pimeloyl-ACP methyl ester carboxylesterase